jgi:hypothetical protein
VYILTLLEGLHPIQIENSIIVYEKLTFELVRPSVTQRPAGILCRSAAQRLNITQSAVNQQVEALEVRFVG